MTSPSLPAQWLATAATTIQASTMNHLAMRSRRPPGVAGPTFVTPAI
jgi:hypothetical protein